MSRCLPKRQSCHPSDSRWSRLTLWQCRRTERDLSWLQSTHDTFREALLSLSLNLSRENIIESLPMMFTAAKSALPSSATPASVKEQVQLLLMVLARPEPHGPISQLLSLSARSPEEEVTGDEWAELVRAQLLAAFQQLDRAEIALSVAASGPSLLPKSRVLPPRDQTDRRLASALGAVPSRLDALVDVLFPFPPPELSPSAEEEVDTPVPLSAKERRAAELHLDAVLRSETGLEGKRMFAGRVKEKEAKRKRKEAALRGDDVLVRQGSTPEAGGDPATAVSASKHSPPITIKPSAFLWPNICWLTL